MGFDVLFPHRTRTRAGVVFPPQEEKLSPHRSGDDGVKHPNTSPLARPHLREVRLVRPSVACAQAYACVCVCECEREKGDRGQQRASESLGCKATTYKTAKCGRYKVV